MTIFDIFLHTVVLTLLELFGSFILCNLTIKEESTFIRYSSSVSYHPFAVDPLLAISGLSCFLFVTSELLLILTRGDSSSEISSSSEHRYSEVCMMVVDFLVSLLNLSSINNNLKLLHPSLFKIVKLIKMS